MTNNQIVHRFKRDELDHKLIINEERVTPWLAGFMGKFNIPILL